MHVVYAIDSLQPSGAELSLLAMVPHLVEHGVRIDIAHFDTRPGLGPKFEAAGAEVHQLTGRGRVGRALAMRRLIRQLGPDLVHTTLFEADVAGRIGGRLAGATVTSSIVNAAYGPEQRGVGRPPGWKLEAARLLDLSTARLARRFHALTEVSAVTMGGRLHLPADLVDVVPRGREPGELGRRSKARSDSMRAALDVAPPAVVVLAVARHEHQKGLDVLIEAFAGVRASEPTALLLVAGREGAATPSLRVGVERWRLGDAVRLLGARTDVAELLCCADIFVFPSRWEGFGSTLVEALALETLVVASDLPVIREVLDDGRGTCCGVLVPVGDHVALANAIVSSIDRRADDDLTTAGRSLFERRYTAAAAAAGMLAFHQRSLA